MLARARRGTPAAPLALLALLPACQSLLLTETAALLSDSWHPCHDLIVLIQSEVRPKSGAARSPNATTGERQAGASRQLAQVNVQSRGPPTRVDWHWHAAAGPASGPAGSALAPSNASANLVAPSRVILTAPARKKLPQTHTKMAKQLAFPSVVLCIGIAMLPSVLTRTLAKLIVFFGMQALMNLFMKAVLSSAVISETRHIEGFQAPFLVTGVQQLTSTGVFLLGMLLLRTTRWRCRLRRPETSREWLLVALASLTFSLSVALNNFSLMLLPMSVNLAIRSCSPLVMLLIDKLRGGTPFRLLDLALIFAGAFSTFWVGMAQVTGRTKGDPFNISLGVACCLASVVAYCINLTVANYLEAECKLSPVDTMAYMTLPTILMLVLPVFLVKHPVDWPGTGYMTDWAVFNEVARMNGSVAGLAVFSGLFAFGFNMLMLLVVQRLSVDQVASFATINRAATIALALSVGLEVIPLKPWDTVLLLAVAGNTLAFLLHSKTSAGSTPKSAGSVRDERKAMF